MVNTRTSLQVKLSVKLRLGQYIRRCDDDFGINELLVEFAVLALLIGCGDERVALIFNPFPQTKLVLSCAEQFRLLLSVLVALQVAC